VGGAMVYLFKPTAPTKRHIRRKLSHNQTQLSHEALVSETKTQKEKPKQLLRQARPNIDQAWRSLKQPFLKKSASHSATTSQYS